MMQAMPRQPMKNRSLIAGGVVLVAVIIVVFYARHERNQEFAELQAAARDGSATPGAAASGSGSSAAAAPQRIRKIDKAARESLATRIERARARRGSGSVDSSSSSGTTTPPPSLPSLPGTISKDDIRAGVRAVIPLLAECYDAAQDRLTNKKGQIIVKMHLTGEPEVGTLIDKADIEGDAHFTADKDLVECFQQTMLSVELPPIAEGGTVDVTYPIAFAPG
jgi:hypothetical protein